MADILLTVGVDTSLSYAEFQAGITSLVAQVNANPPKIKLKFDDSSLSSMRKQIESMTKAAASAGSLTRVNGYTQTNSGIWLKDTAAIKANTQAKTSNARKLNPYDEDEYYCIEYAHFLLVRILYDELHMQSFNERIEKLEKKLGI